MEPKNALGPGVQKPTDHSSPGAAAVVVPPYTTDCYAEFYDLWCDSFVVGRHAADEETYWTAIQAAIRSRKSTPHEEEEEGDSSDSNAINIIEIGTGTGRVLKDLFERAAAVSSISSSPDACPFPPNLQFYGIDPSAPMLQRARTYFNSHPALASLAPPIDWVQGSGEDFLTGTLPSLAGACDLVMWTGGGFSHLRSPDSQLAFLVQLRMALRDSGSARAIILIYDQSIPSRRHPDASRVFEVPWCGRSESDPSLLYRKSENEVTFEEGEEGGGGGAALRRDRWEISVWKEKEGGEGGVGEVEVHSETVDHTLLDLDEGGWPALVERAGLKIEREEVLEGMGVFFFLKRGD